MADFPSLGQTYTDIDSDSTIEDYSYTKFTIFLIYGVLIVVLCIFVAFQTINITDLYQTNQQLQNKIEYLERKISSQEKTIETLQIEYRLLRTDTDILFKYTYGEDPFYSEKEEYYE